MSIDDMLMTTNDVAVLLGVSTARVREFVHSKRLAAVKIAGLWFFDPEEVERFLGTPRMKRGWKKGVKRDGCRGKAEAC